ncbi:MFS transporter [Alicyclobacillus fastidiosus]|uniref:MFS transporter n=1 Tax=Alicyclobacillus fastidiosus TaxID=392011 RepID=A0ABV5AD94_9BACL|nr:MFS transporter [Alicyclobacillus fastidiosus]WEH11466.1 MFS transporter [Alicyclobacillus fastidiosus]
MRSRTNARWFFIVPSIMVFWMIGNIDKLGISIVVSNHSFLNAMNLQGKTARIALLSTGFTFAYAIANFFWGIVADRWGPRRVAIFGTSVWGLMMILGGISTTYGALLASRILLGIGEAILWVVSTKFSANWFSKKEVSRAQSLWFIGNTLGPAIGAPLIVAVMAGTWRNAFFMLAALSLVIAMPMFVFLTRNTPSEHFAVNEDEIAYIQSGKEIPITQDERESITIFTAKWRYWLIVLAHVSFGYVFFGLSFWLPTYLKTIRHFSASSMAGWTSVSWIFGVVGALLAGYIIDRSRRASALGIVCAVIGAIVMYIGAITGTAAISAAMLSIGVACQQAAMIVNLYLLQKFVPTRSIGSATGIMAGFSTLLGGFAPMVIGALVSLTGGSFMMGIDTLVVFALLALIAYICILPSERTLRDKSVETSVQIS